MSLRNRWRENVSAVQPGGPLPAPSPIALTVSRSLRIGVSLACLISSCTLAQTAAPAIVQQIPVEGEHPLVEWGDNAAPRRVAVLSVRYVPERSEDYAQVRSAPRNRDGDSRLLREHQAVLLTL